MNLPSHKVIFPIILTRLEEMQYNQQCQELGTSHSDIAQVTCSDWENMISFFVFNIQLKLNIIIEIAKVYLQRYFLSESI